MLHAQSTSLRTYHIECISVIILPSRGFTSMEFYLHFAVFVLKFQLLVLVTGS